MGCGGSKNDAKVTDNFGPVTENYRPATFAAAAGKNPPAKGGPKASAKKPSTQVGSGKKSEAPPKSVMAGWLDKKNDQAQKQKELDVNTPSAQGIRMPAGSPGAAGGGGGAPGGGPGGAGAGESEAGQRKAPQMSQNIFRESEAISHVQFNQEGKVDLRSTLREAGDRLVIVLFFENECESCEAMRILYEEFVVKYPDCLFLEANVQYNSEPLETLRVKFLPTFVAFRNHLEVGRLVSVDAFELEDMIQQNTPRKKPEAEEI